LLLYHLLLILSLIHELEIEFRNQLLLYSVLKLSFTELMLLQHDIIIF
jgi:hypothetical protein